jgi:hypothetical protein
MTSEIFDPTPVLRGLKDFQRRTVDYVFDRMYGPAPVSRFLVADEVGLGKTLVARGLIARAIERLQRDGIDRIDIVYVCSNADIARQNINRLNVTGRQEFNLPTRLTLLPLHLRQIKSHGLNFVSFTPGTTFDLKSRGGLAQERALILRLLQLAWGRAGLTHAGVYKLLQGGASAPSFRWQVDQIPQRVGTTEGTIDEDLVAAFVRELEGEERASRAASEPGVRERFLELADQLRRSKRDLWDDRSRLVGELRTLLARSCVRALEVDLVILDEFQRFRDLLDGRSDAAELAGHLFNEPGARVVLLSATPYKMYTLVDERDEDHYSDFIRTARFLMGADEAHEFERELRSFRHALLDLQAGDADDVIRRKRRVERRLRRFMVRTERLGVTDDRNGMLIDSAMNDVRLEASDLRAYLTAHRVSRFLRAGDALEYWKSGSYLLNFMESYKLKAELHTAKDDPDRSAGVASLIEDADGMLDRADVEAYRRIDPGNARLRGLMADTVDREAWRLLWLPPSCPEYRLGPPFDGPGLSLFTKRLVFSSWTVVPQVIASLTSYEVERRMMRSRPGRHSYEGYQQQNQLLRFSSAQGRVTTMSLFAIMYPSPSLAALGDPHEISIAKGGAVEPPDLEGVLARAELRISRALAPIVRGRPMDGPVDERWYWAAPLLLDQLDGSWAERWLRRWGVHERWTGKVTGRTSEGSLWASHIAVAREVFVDDSQLGRVPDDLVLVLARIAVGGPATCALRAFARISGGPRTVTDDWIRDGAARVAWGFRSFFNVPEVAAMIRGRGSRERPYWMRVVDYCVNGGLQAVMTEYAHVLREALGFLSRDPATVIPAMADATNEALSIRASNYSVDDVRAVDGMLAIEPHKMRARFALRFGAQSVEAESELQRAAVVRTAFNSPFWPFVLATTSVGQEGLDFHLYCHAVVHWNLPANPVDLEQREGRVHRYKGHAIRKNIAQVHRAAAFRRGVSDPWDAMFDAARRARGRRLNDLWPYWIYTTEGGAQIERYVPSLPFSREVEKLPQLKRSLAAYRLVFGQPRQEDLAAFLQRVRGIDRPVDLSAFVVDLSPGPVRRRTRSG